MNPSLIHQSALTKELSGLKDDVVRSLTKLALDGKLVMNVNEFKMWLILIKDKADQYERVLYSKL